MACEFLIGFLKSQGARGMPVKYPELFGSVLTAEEESSEHLGRPTKGTNIYSNLVDVFSASF